MQKQNISHHSQTQLFLPEELQRVSEAKAVLKLTMKVICIISNDVSNAIR